jgi:hypothetical protein
VGLKVTASHISRHCRDPECARTSTTHIFLYVVLTRGQLHLVATLQAAKVLTLGMEGVACKKMCAGVFERGALKNESISLVTFFCCVSPAF